MVIGISLGLLGLLVLGSLMALILNLGSSKSQSEVDINTNVSEKKHGMTKEPEVLTEQYVNRIPSRTFFLNTYPIGGQPNMQPVMKQIVPTSLTTPMLYDDHNRLISHSSDINNLYNVVKANQRIKDLENTNKLLEENNLNIKNDITKIDDFQDFVSKLQSSMENDKNSVCSELVDAFDFIGKIRSSMTEGEKNKIIECLEGLNTGKLVKKNNEDIKILDHNNINTTRDITIKQMLVECFKTILKSKNIYDIITDVDEIIMQLSKDNDADAQLISNGLDIDNETLDAVFQNKLANIIRSETLQNIKTLCEKLKTVQNKIWQRTIDDDGRQTQKLSCRSIRNKFLFGNEYHSNAEENDKKQPNNANFNQIVIKINKQNTLNSQTKIYLENNKNSIIKDLNKNLLGQFKLFHKAHNDDVKEKIKINIKTLIKEQLNKASNEEKTTEPKASDRKIMWDYLKKIGVKMSQMPAGGSEGDKKTDIVKIDDNIEIKLGGCFLEDKEQFKKLANYVKNEKSIKSNENEIKKLNKQLMQI